MWRMNNELALKCIRCLAGSRRVRWIVNWKERSERYVEKYVPHAHVDKIEFRDDEVVVHLSY